MSREENNTRTGQIVLRTALYTGSFISFCVTILLLLENMPASAGISLVLTFGMLAFTYISELEVLKISGVLEAKLQKKISEAETLTRKLQNSIDTFSKLSVALLAVSNRWSGLNAWEERDLVDDIIRIAENTDIEESRVEEIVQPHLSYASLDIFYIFKNLVDHRLSQYRQIRTEAESIITKNVNPPESKPDALAEYRALNDDLTPQDFEPNPSVSKDKRLRNIQKLCMDYIKKFPLTEEDCAVLIEFSGYIDEIATRIWRERRVPDQAIELKEHFQEQNAYEEKITELFGEARPNWQPRGLP